MAKGREFRAGGEYFVVERSVRIDQEVTAAGRYSRDDSLRVTGTRSRVNLTEITCDPLPRVARLLTTARCRVLQATDTKCELIMRVKVCHQVFIGFYTHRYFSMLAVVLLRELTQSSSAS